MIDTVKIYCPINELTYQVVISFSDEKVCLNHFSNIIQYQLFNDKVEGSYSSNLNVRVGDGTQFGFVDDIFHYYLSIEGSYHKIVKGYNSHNGFIDFEYVVRGMISLVEKKYQIKLPTFEKWRLQRSDISICYNLSNQANVKKYINSLSRCTYPRRKMQFYTDTGVYCSGSSSSLKIYNKMLEFIKHDKNKFIDTDFNLIDYQDTIKGFCRFECEIHKKKLVSLYNSKEIFCKNVNYNDLLKVWSDEFMKLLKCVESDLEIVRGWESVEYRLKSFYKDNLAKILVGFYSEIQLKGFDVVKDTTSERSFYRKVKQLKDAGIDISQHYKFDEVEVFRFNPFTDKFLEVA